MPAAVERLMLRTAVAAHRNPQRARAIARRAAPAASAAGFLAERQRVAARERRARVGSGAGRLDPPAAFDRERRRETPRAKECTHEPHGVPVVEARALEFAIVDGEAERLDQVQRAAGGRAQARDVAGVGRNLPEARPARRAAGRPRRRAAATMRCCGLHLVMRWRTREQVGDAFGRRHEQRERHAVIRASCARARRPVRRRAAPPACAGSFTTTSPRASKPRTTRMWPAERSSGAPGSEPARHAMLGASGRPRRDERFDGREIAQICGRSDEAARAGIGAANAQLPVPL